MCSGCIVRLCAVAVHKFQVCSGIFRFGFSALDMHLNLGFGLGLVLGLGLGLYAKQGLY